MKIKALLAFSVILISAIYFTAVEDSSEESKGVKSSVNLDLTKTNFPEIRNKTESNVKGLHSYSENGQLKAGVPTTTAVKQASETAGIDTPDEIWEKQSNNDTPDEFPAIESEYVVVSDEMKVAEEAFFSKSRSEYLEVDNLDENEFNIDELPPSFVDYAELMPFELQESENLFRIEGYEKSFSEPLTDPFTGLSDQEVVNMGDQLPASETYDSVD